MKKLILACALTVSAATAGGLALMAPASAQPWNQGNWGGLPDGSWRDSCRYPQMRGNYLSAECRTSYDRWVNTSLNVNNCRTGRVGNNDGRLVCENRGGGYYPGGGWNLPNGSWRQSCRYGVMRGSYLSAQCPDRDGRWSSSSIDVRSCRGDGISNQDGRLYCGGGYGGGGGGGNWGGGYPGGSWRDTCRNIDLRGSYLSAQCRDGGGSWSGTSIDLRDCRSNRVGNRDGRLVCEY